MSDRTIEWGDPPSYATGDGGEDAPDGNFVVAQVPGGGTKLLEYDDSANAWQMRGDVNHNGNDITNVGALSTDSTQTKRIGSDDYHYAGDYDGSDADTRLDNAISAANTGERIFLENGEYNSDRTISKKLTIVGQNGKFGAPDVNGTWTISAVDVKIKDIFIDDANGGQIIIDDIRVQVESCMIENVTSNGIQVNDDRALLVTLSRGSVTFASGTADGIVDSSQSVTVTDNGTNTVGDIS